MNESSTIYLKDLVLKSLSNFDIADNVRLSMSVIVDGVPIKTISPANREENIWTFNDHFEIGTTVPSFVIVVHREITRQRKKGLCSIRISSSRILDQSDLSVQLLSESNAKPLLELASKLSTTSSQAPASAPPPCRRSTFHLPRSTAIHSDPAVQRFLQNFYEAVTFMPDTTPIKHKYLTMFAEAWLDRYRTSLDPDTLNMAIITHQDASQCSAGQAEIRFAQLMMLGMLLFSRFQSNGNRTDIDTVISTFSYAKSVLCGHLPSEFLMNLGSAYLARYQNFDDIADLDQSLSILQGAAEFARPDITQLRAMNNLAEALGYRFKLRNDIADLHAQISILEKVTTLANERDKHKPRYLRNLATSLRSRYERIRDVKDLNQAISIGQDAIRLTHDSDINKPSLLFGLGMSLKARSLLYNNRTDTDTSISMLQNAIQCPNSNLDKSECSNALGVMLATRFRQTGDPADINKSIAVFREAMQLMVPKTLVAPEWPVAAVASISSLSCSLQARYSAFGDLMDFNESVVLSRQAVQLAPDDSTVLQNHAMLLISRFNFQHDTSDLDEALSTCRKADQLIPSGHPDKSSSLTSFGGTLLQRYQENREIADLSNAISLFQKALQELSSDDNPFLLEYLGQSLSDRFERTGNITDIHDSISTLQKSIQITRDRAPQNLPHRLDTLGRALLLRFRHLGDFADITNSVATLREGVSLVSDGHEDKGMLLSTLSRSLEARFQSTGNIEDLTCSVSILEELFLFSPVHIDAESLHNLSSRLFTRFERLGNLKDLDDSISKIRQAIQLAGRETYRYLNTLGNGLFRRFQQLNGASDIAEACEVLQKASHSIPDDHPYKPAVLNNLASSYLGRWNKLRHRSDLDAAIIVLQGDNHSTLDSSTKPVCPTHLQTLGIALHYRFMCDRDLNDIDNSIAFRKSYLDSLAGEDSLEASSCLNGIGSSLVSRFMVTHSRADIDSSIEFFQRALMPLPDDNPFLNARIKISLADAFLARFRASLESHSGHKELITVVRLIPDTVHKIKPVPENVDDLMENFMRTEPCGPHELEVIKLSVSESNAANSLTAAAPPNPIVLEGIEAYKRFQLEPYKDAHQAIAHLSSVACLAGAAPSIRFQAASEWLNYARLSMHPSLFEAQHCVVNLLPQVAWLGVSVDGRHQRLMELGHVARHAAAIALEYSQNEQALEWLEQSRCIVWSQLLQLRTPLDDVHQRDPKRAEELLQISRELEDTTNSLAGLDTQANQLKTEELAQECHRLAEDHEKMIEEIRGLDGFEHFLHPPQASYLLEAASKHPIVFLVANDDSSICLVLQSTSIHHIPLPSLHNRMLQELVHLVQAAVSRLPTKRSLIDLEQTQEKVAMLLRDDHGIRMPKRVRFDDTVQYSDDAFRSVLRILWEKIVKPVIHFLGIQKSGEIPVIQWCPTGLFTFLPIHAAGCYDVDLEMECASDYIISSYTPTIGALLAHPPVSPAQEFKMIVVIQSNDLPATKRELESIQKHVCSDALIKLGVPGTPANIEGVASHLSSASIVHFACHGKQDRFKPLDSGLVLDDGLLSVSRIIKEPVPNGSLAFLCACETTMGDEKLPDEAVSLGASLLFSGFRRVVGTMWEMMDEDGPTIADIFYEELFKGPDGSPSLEPNIAKSAQALHAAVGKLRSRNVSFRRWVPFIHMGK